jgi:hypothetical protein
MLAGGFVNTATKIEIRARGAKLESCRQLTSEWFTRHLPALAVA